MRGSSEESRYGGRGGRGDRGGRAGGESRGISRGRGRTILVSNAVVIPVEDRVIVPEMPTLLCIRRQFLRLLIMAPLRAVKSEKNNLRRGDVVNVPTRCVQYRIALAPTSVFLLGMQFRR